MEKEMTGTLVIYTWCSYVSPEGMEYVKLIPLERHKRMDRADAIALVNDFKKHNKTLSYKFTPDAELL